MATWHFYTISPIDIWEGGFTRHELIERHGSDGFNGIGYARLVDRVLKIAATLGSYWEGDIRQGPFLFFIPEEFQPAPCVVWKQDNNGTTFVASAVPLPHLEDHYGLNERPLKFFMDADVSSADIADSYNRKGC